MTRLLRRLLDCLPRYSTRRAAREWLKGYELGQRHRAFARDLRGRFKRLS